jgi:hypothetical protein
VGLRLERRGGKTVELEAFGFGGVAMAAGLCGHVIGGCGAEVVKYRVGYVYTSTHLILI